MTVRLDSGEKNRWNRQGRGRQLKRKRFLEEIIGGSRSSARIRGVFSGHLVEAALDSSSPHTLTRQGGTQGIRTETRHDFRKTEVFQAILEVVKEGQWVWRTVLTRRLVAVAGNPTRPVLILSVTGTLTLRYSPSNCEDTPLSVPRDNSKKKSMIESTERGKSKCGEWQATLEAGYKHGLAPPMHVDLFP